MENNPQIQKNRRLPWPWLVLGIALLIMLGAAIIPALIKDKSPPKPTGEFRQSRVDLIIQSNVGGAEVYLDGQHKGFTSDTKYQARLFNLARKTYQITLKKEGYADGMKTVEITGKALTQNVQIDIQPNGEELQ